MPYQIDKTDGTVLITLADGVVDNSTDLQLVGRNVAGYGEQQNENFVKLLENFARADTPPSKPLVGQLWFDKNADKLRPSVFDGVQWRNLTINQVSATEPQGQKEGDLWWDTVNNKLYVFVADGDQHVLVGPESVLGFGKTRWSSEKLTDTGGTDHPVSIGYVDGAPYMVMADTAFEIDQTATPLNGFTRIGEGITAKGTNVDGVTTSATTRFFGSATDADRLGGRLASTWANRNDNEIITGAWQFQNDTGINVGANSELQLSIDGNIARIWNAGGNNLKLGVNYSGSGTDKTTIELEEKAVLPYANNQVSLGSPSKNFRNIYAQDIYANFIGTLAGSMVGTTTGANRGQLQDSTGQTIVDPETGLSYTINVGNSQATNGLTVVDVDATTTAPIIPANAGTRTGRFEGVAAFVDYGVYTNQNNTLTGNNTYNGTSQFNGSVNITSSQTTNANLSVGRIGRGAITTPSDPNQNIGDMLIDRVTIQDSRINNPDLRAGSISNGTVIDGADIGKNAPAIQVKAQKFVDAVGRTVTRISDDGQFLQNSASNLVTERAIKEYVDTVFQSTGQDIQFYLDTKDMTQADVKTQLTRLAPPSNFKEGTIARVLGSYYYGNLGVNGSGNPIYVKKYSTVFRGGIGYIGGRNVESGAGIITDIIDRKAATTGYEYQLSATGNVTVDSQTFPTNSNSGTFSTLLTNGTLTGWLVFPNAPLNADQADEFSTDAVQGAKVVIVRNGLVESYSSNEGLLQLVVGNVTYERAGASTWNSSVNIAGFATTVQVYAFDRTSRTSSAAWVFKGNF
jgi:hypothetical protein